MTRKEQVEKKAELCKLYKDAIGDFRKYFEQKKKLMKAKRESDKKEDGEKPESEET
jgi:hypothetical protein